MINKDLDKKSIVLIPAYQPSDNLIRTTDRLILEGFIVVVVNDGSESQYQSVFDSLNKKIYLVHYNVNKGKGAALKTGYRFISDNFRNYIVITADADGQHSVSDISKLAAEYHKTPKSLLLGVRQFEKENVPFKSKFGNIITRKVYALITKKPMSDTQTGLRVFDQSLVDFMLKIPGQRFEYEMNVLLDCSSKGVDIAELPIETIYRDNNSHSHFNPITDSIAIYREVIKFASSSLLAFATDYGLYVLFLHLTSSWSLSSSVTFANILSRVISATMNFSINKHVIFKHKGETAKGAVSYALLACGILIGNTLLLNFLIGIVGFNPYLAKILTEVALFGISYSVQKKIIFAKKVIKE